MSVSARRRRRPTDEFSGEVRAENGNYDHSSFEGTFSGPTGINGLDFRISGYDTNQNDGSKMKIESP